MKGRIRGALLSVFGLGAVLLLLAAGGRDDADHQPGNVCSFRSTEGLYGFTCSGFAQGAPGVLEPISFAGYVRGDGHGAFEGPLTVNTSAPIGTIHERVKGRATLDPNRECIGTVVYDQNSIEIAPGIYSPPGSAPNLTAEFVIVESGNEILGLPVEPGQTGASVPRLTCRLAPL